MSTANIVHHPRLASDAQTMRIALFTECYRPIQNGVVASVDALAEAIRERGHDVVCVTPKMPRYRDVDDYVVRIPSLPLPTRTGFRLTLPLTSARVARALGRLSIVHTHSPFVTGWLGERLARKLGVPLVFTYHTQLEEYAHYFPFESTLTRQAAASLTQTYANRADAVVVPTAAMERRLRRLGVRRRIEVIPSGIDVALFAAGRRREELRSRLGVPAGGKMILFVGRLGREKNLELVLDAFARIGEPSARLVVVGDGLHRAALERRARSLGVAERTRFTGEFERRALPDVYASADVFAFPSRSETQGLVLVEASVAGVPVVAVDTPQTRDVLEDSAELVPAEPEAFARALMQASSDRVGRVAVAGLAERFDRGIVGDRIIDLYKDLVGR